jgi:SAM-dependent methyltransferase
VSAFESMRTAYEGVESAFAEGELAAYRASALAKTMPQAAFLAERIAGSLIEIGCGNGRLLIALRSVGAIESGLGIDIAQSRVDFARDWARDLGLDGLEFRAGDALELSLGTGYGAAACITGAFGYFDAYVPASGRRLLEKLRGSLAPAGSLILELYQHPAELTLLENAGGLARTWIELPPSDPWRFYLSETSLEGNVMVHRKTFVHRTDGTVDEGRCERLAIHAPADIRAWCHEAGFAEVELFEGWTRDAYCGGATMVVVANT